MSSSPNPFGSFGASRYADPAEQAVTRAVGAFFNAVYAWMCAGLALTAVVAMWVASRPDIVLQVGKFFFALVIVELILVASISIAVNRISAGVATLLFLLYAALNGLTLAGIFLVYTHAVLASAFAVTAGMFGAMSLFGFLTRKDLSGLGSMLFMALIGVVIASVVSIFWHPTWFSVLLNYVGVAVFVGLTAYDTQRLKMLAIQTAGSGALAARFAVNGALSLYLDFLNMFLFILSIFGDRNR
jgi:hypothetical protein